MAPGLWSATHLNLAIKIRVKRNYLKDRKQCHLDSETRAQPKVRARCRAYPSRVHSPPPAPLGGGERPHPYANSSAPSTGAGTRRVPGDPSAAARSDPSCSASNPPSDHTSNVAPTVCSATECARS